MTADTRTNESCVIYEETMSRMTHHGTHKNESHHTYEGFIYA